MDKNAVLLQIAIIFISLIDVVSLVGAGILFYHRVFRKLAWGRQLNILWWSILILSTIFLAYVAYKYLISPTPRNYEEGIAAYAITTAMIPTIFAGFVSLLLKPRYLQQRR